jgi:hypothetical protein
VTPSLREARDSQSGAPAPAREHLPRAPNFYWVAAGRDVPVSLNSGVAPIQREPGSVRVRAAPASRQFRGREANGSPCDIPVYVHAVARVALRG